MNGYDSYSEHQPVTWIRGYPVYAAYLVVLVYTVSMMVYALAHTTGILNPLIFSSSQVLQGQVWRVLTYGLVNQPSLGFVFDMYMLAVFGREVERFFGRSLFLRLTLYLYLLSPLLFTLIGLGLHQSIPLAGETGAFAMFVAFATLYPNAVLLFNILAKWAAVVLVGIYSLIALSNRDLIELISLLATTGFAFVFIRHAQGHFRLPSFKLKRPQPHLRVLPDPSPRSRPANQILGGVDAAEVDALLEKIALSGMSSLSDKERAKLEAAREKMLNKGRARRP